MYFQRLCLFITIAEAGKRSDGQNQNVTRRNVTNFIRRDGSDGSQEEETILKECVGFKVFRCEAEGNPLKHGGYLFTESV